MPFLRNIAIWVIGAELLIAGVLIAGTFVPLPSALSIKIVQSGSMEPAMPVGSLVFIMPATEYVAGDVITFGAPDGKGIPTTHRIIETARESGSVAYMTKGDANEHVDHMLIPHETVIGRVAYTVPRLGYVFHYARTQQGFLLMVVVPAALIILDEILTIFGVLRGRLKERSRTAVCAREDTVEAEEVRLVASPAVMPRQTMAHTRERQAPPPQSCSVSFDGIVRVTQSV